MHMWTSQATGKMYSVHGVLPDFQKFGGWTALISIQSDIWHPWMYSDCVYVENTLKKLLFNSENEYFHKANSQHHYRRCPLCAHGAGPPPLSQLSDKIPSIIMYIFIYQILSKAREMVWLGTCRATMAVFLLRFGNIGKGVWNPGNISTTLQYRSIDIPRRTPIK